MWTKRSDTHCSDDLLLAHLDGELHGLARFRTAAHLRRCWECRAHLSELENDAEALARLMAGEASRESGQIVEAKAAFLAWKDGFEASIAPARRNRSRVLQWSLAAAGACVVAALFLIPGPAPRREAVPAAAEVLRGIRGFEAGLGRQAGAVHRVLRVDVAQIRPVVRRSAGRVEIWSDRAGGRFASRWLDERSTLKYAAWDLPGKAPYTYAATAGHSGADGVSLLDPAAGALTVEGLERAFFEWLRAHDWQPAAGLSEVFSRDGTRLQVERLDSGGLRMRASRSGRAVRADFTVEVEAGSFRPKLQVLRFETDERTMEIRVASDRLEVVPMARVNAAVFEPDAPRITGMPPLPPLRPETPVPQAPLEVPIGEVETEVLYELHRARACVGENVQVSTTAAGQIDVRAIVRSKERRAELEEILQHAGRGRVRAEIQVLEQGRPGPLRNHPLLPPDGVRAIDALYVEGLALMRLAERYTPGARLTDRQKLLVDAMVRDHVAVLNSGTRLARTEAEAALVPMAGPQRDGVSATGDPADWTAAAFGIFQTLDRTDDLIDPSGGSEAPDVRRKQAAAVLNAMAELEQRVKHLDGMIANRLAESATKP